ncbi:MAG: A24 family peptidase [Planctomycetota bacterium]|nr:A24 family peptidase [Planctomycetota bacterium]MDA1178631.1 A24 family peptidase [Planctomycetota bacterium]
MIQGWLQWPLELRAACLGILGLLVATQINRAIYRWAWHARAIGPWSPSDPRASAPQWQDRIPVLGWWFLRRDAAYHGIGYWIRPMLLEVGFGSAWMFLYVWLCQGGNLPLHLPCDVTIAHAQFLSQACLIVWMTIATFIDIDEQTIPDLVTIPGALMGLVIAVVLPASSLPTWSHGKIEPLHLASPAGFPGHLADWPAVLLGVLIYLGWWFAIWPKTICLRHGYAAAVRYLVGSMRRHRAFSLYVLLSVAGSLAIVYVGRTGGISWQSLLSALLGLAWGGAMVWGVRIVGTLALGREAMGFGDVTLLAMIGAYLGWQSVTFVFFIAPFTGVLLALTQWLLTGRPAIPYGPFLCAATLVVLFTWPALWERNELVFRLGIGIPVIGLMCLFLMGGMLMAWRRISS